MIRFFQSLHVCMSTARRESQKPGITKPKRGTCALIDICFLPRAKSLALHVNAPRFPEEARLISPAGLISALCSCSIFQEGLQRNCSLYSLKQAAIATAPQKLCWEALTVLSICFFLELEIKFGPGLRQ